MSRRPPPRFTGTPEQWADGQHCRSCGRVLRPDSAPGPRLATHLVATYCTACEPPPSAPHMGPAVVTESRIVQILGDGLVGQAVVEAHDDAGRRWRRRCGMTRWAGVAWLHRPFSDWVEL